LKIIFLGNYFIENEEKKVPATFVKKFKPAY